MTTNKSGEEIQAEYERLAREQLGLDEQWRLGTIATALPIGLEDQIDRLDADSELCDDERWRELTTYSAPLAWLPEGVIQVTMISGRGSNKQQKAGFILTQRLLSAEMRGGSGKPVSHGAYGIKGKKNV